VISLNENSRTVLAELVEFSVLLEGEVRELIVTKRKGGRGCFLGVVGLDKN
jgi:hypothetical protein